MKRAPLPSQRKALPEYLKLMLTDVKRERLHKQAMQSSQNGTFVAESTAAPPPELQQDTPPHIVPFPARTLVLNLCPPHGHALLPPPPPKPAPTRDSFGQGRQWTTKFRGNGRR